ncbi:hypothetical protein [Candidatus Poriferisodalis sp.]|uniref:hypothetical protein n=1 Tax=Candidatus Poriferisodalis sp. TaxID=3101277 RepID=UPI003B028992
MSDRVAHLQIIQGVINRLSQNSFLLKGWAVVLVSGLFALAAGNSEILFVYLAYLPAIAFWCLDAYFLRQERLYRALYDEMREVDEADVDFSMDTRSVADKVAPWYRVAVSPTIIAFHLTLIGAVALVMAIILGRQ